MKPFISFFMEKMGKQREEDLTNEEIYFLMIVDDYLIERDNPKVRDIIKEEKQNLKV